jgi:hypothetical protein
MHREGKRESSKIEAYHSTRKRNQQGRDVPFALKGKAAR